jgi:Mn-dependent DtxR family transcriptional regulator
VDSITQNELLEALQAAMHGTPDAPEGGASSEDLARALHLSRETVRTWLRHLAREGRLDVLRVPRLSLGGKMVPHTLYRLKP